MKDRRRHATCTGQCASFWPPLKWKGSGRPKAAAPARTKLLGLDRDPAGGKVVTYSEWPLYTYDGGKWYVITAKGKLVKHRH